MDTDEFIAATMRRVADSATPPLGEPLTHTRTRRWVAPLAVAAAVGVVALAGLATVLGSDDPDGSESGQPATTEPASGCRVDYDPAPLPEWARAGFTPPDQAVPHVLGDDGDMVAILWATHHPLEAPPAADENNKILWVARVGASDGPLEIRATLGNRTVTRTVAPAPGPSGIDLPAAGCWSIDLRWGEHEDHLMLGYAPR
ncbi:hypothetical protein ASC77_07680 [Nocardioides sp. Root1257]|uniref:hypothetical protein n=1 Tax=unclassified Nocardioides TaxID=2615069 RepID=UPI0006F5D1C4|nr:MULTISPECIES: hypothetical protein [unclassified Nocardioides]KQW48612.1 hypothetical protein ASC77_07680 [Nocardioides sp. Root1257]KRC47788.1 hypothetical protein ASE24_07685 [Nocardioides sp. Root224]